MGSVKDILKNGVEMIYKRYNPIIYQIVNTAAAARFTRVS